MKKKSKIIIWICITLFIIVSAIAIFLIKSDTYNLFKKNEKNEEVIDKNDGNSSVRDDNERDDKIDDSIIYPTIMEKILDDNEEISDKDIDFSYMPSGCKNYSYATKQCTTYDSNQVTNGLFYTADEVLNGEDGKRIYYYRGDVDNNWVSFAGYKWRIVRTNSEGGVKLLYAGDGTTENSGIITYATYNGSQDNKYYVGYTYDKNLSTLSGTKEEQTDSVIKKVIDAWYSGTKTSGTECGGSSCDFTKLKNKVSDYSSYLSLTAIYCSDKTIINETDGNVIFSGENRIDIDNKPTYACAEENGSRYTVDSVSGNGYLDYPIATLSADEIKYAGLDSSIEGTDREPYIMNNAYSWWTMTPSRYSITASIYKVDIDTMYSDHVYHSGVGAVQPGVRPSISLKSCVGVTKGNGTFESPYEISDSEC